jgi:FdhE protein
MPNSVEGHSVRNWGVIIEAMAQNEWQKRVERADELASQHSCASEILRFYAVIARFQEEFWGEILKSRAWFDQAASESEPFARPLPIDLAPRFASFLSLVKQNGPGPLKNAASELQGGGIDSSSNLLTAFWDGIGTGAPYKGPDEFFAHAFLQPYAASLRTRSSLRWNGPTPFVCPFCKGKPGVAVLRPLGDGGQRSLVCSFCLAEWEFRRIVCPGCGEENHANLPVYAADELTHVRIEACDSCQIYIKAVDMTKSGLADPVVDEIASIPLDIWAEQRGYRKLQVNLLQL